MSRASPILFSLLFISAAFLCFQQASSAPFLSDLSAENRTIHKYSGISGDIDIQKDSQGFYVEVDFDYNTHSSQKQEPNPRPYDAGKMMISLYKSETILTSTCLNFSDYDYNKFNWNYNIQAADISYPNFNASTLSGFGNFYLDRNYWSIWDSRFYLTKLDGCQTGVNVSFNGSDRYGVLGFGTDDGSKGNFLTSKNFSVYIKPDLSAGKLLFMNDTANYTASTEVLSRFSADVNWRLLNVNGSLGVKNNSAAFKNNNVIFDIHSDAIGLPVDLFKSFLGYFVSIPGISCSSDLYKPNCTINGTVQNLPNITLSINDTQIKIPPQIYVSPDNSSQFKLNFRATSPDLSGSSYVTPLYKDFIILDAHFMSYYFTVFGFTGGPNVISLYLAATAGGNNPRIDPNHWVIIIGAIVVVFLVIIACCVKRKTAAKNNIAKDSFAYNYTSYNQGVNPH